MTTQHPPLPKLLVRKEPERLAILSPALVGQAPALLDMVKRYQSECAECGGAGITIEDIDCEDCRDIRELIALAEGRC
jgi:hypothetical protein